MCEAGFGFRQKTGFASKLVPFDLCTSSEPQFYRQFGQWSILAGTLGRLGRNFSTPWGAGCDAIGYRRLVAM